MTPDTDQPGGGVDEPPANSASDWQKKYTAALFENDRALLPWRLQEAEQALLLRERVLWATKDETPERAAISNALRVLQAIRARADVGDSTAIKTKQQSRIIFLARR